MSGRDIEQVALKLLWATLRESLAPELTSARAKDRNKRADAALLRIVAGHEQLPALQAEFAPRYEALLRRARELTGAAGIAGPAPGTQISTGEGNPVFIGIPQFAGEIEGLVTAFARADERSGKPTASLDQLLREIVETEADLRGAYEARVAKVAPSVAGGDRSEIFSVQSLQRYLTQHPRGSRDIVVRSVYEIPGGRSKRTVLVALERSGPLPSELVLRLDTGRAVGTSVTQEYPMIERIAKLDLPVPEPLWLETSLEPFGHPCIVFRRMPGAAAGDLIEGAFRKEPATGRALARALGRVHAAGRSLVEPSRRSGRAIADTRELLTYYLEFWRSKKPFPSLVLEAAFTWLFRHINDGLGEATVVHADTGFHNLLLDDAGNGCLLDWEFSHFGDPAEDLASCRPAVERCMPWADFMAEYRASGGKDASDFQLAYWEIWRPLRNVVVCGTVTHSLLNGDADDIDPVTIGTSTFMRLQADLARSLKGVLAVSS